MRVICIAIVIAMMSTFCVYADETDYEQNMEVISSCGVMQAYYFESPKTVSRYECLNAIMKAIGIVEDYSGDGGRFLLVREGGIASDRYYCDGDGNFLVGSDGNALYVTDGRPLMTNKDGSVYDHKKYLERGKTGINFAFAYGIANGEFYNGRRYFYFARAVTLQETILFMMRCLGDLELNDGEEALERAEACGLISKEAPFYGKGEEKLTPEAFSTLLVRFLNQPRHYYFEDTWEYGNRFHEDETGSMTYLEYLTTREVYEE